MQVRDTNILDNIYHIAESTISDRCLIIQTRMWTDEIVSNLELAARHSVIQNVLLPSLTQVNWLKSNIKHKAHLKLDKN